MSNLLLKHLRTAGVVLGDVLPFARRTAAHDLADRTGRAVVLLDSAGSNTGDYWVVTPDDAHRLESAGHKIDKHPPAAAPLDPDAELTGK